MVKKIINLCDLYKDLIWDHSHQQSEHKNKLLYSQTDIYISYICIKMYEKTKPLVDAANELILKINSGYIPQGDYKLDLQFWIFAAKLCFCAKKLDKAAEYAKKAIDQNVLIDKEMLAALKVYLSAHSLKSQKYDEAIKFAKEGLVATGQSNGVTKGDLYYVLFMAYSHKDDFTQADQFLTEGKKNKKVLGRFPMKLDFYFQCARTHHARKNYPEAIKSAEEGIKIAKLAKDTSYALKFYDICALSHKDNNDPKKAAETYANAYQLRDNQSIDVKTNKEVSIKYYNYLLEIKESSNVTESNPLLEVGLQCISLLLKDKKTDKAIKMVLELIAHPSIQSSKESLSVLIKKAQEIKGSDPQLAKVFLEIAKVYNQRKEYQEVSNIAALGLSKNPKEELEMGLLKELVIANRELSNLDQGISYCNQALAKGPSENFKMFFLKEALQAWAKKEQNADNNDSKAAACLEQAKISQKKEDYEGSVALTTRGLGYKSTVQQVRRDLRQIKRVSWMHTHPNAKRLPSDCESTEGESITLPSDCESTGDERPTLQSESEDSTGEASPKVARASVKPVVQEPAKNPELKPTAELPEPISEAPKPTQTAELEPEVEAPQPTQVKTVQSEFKLIFNPPEVEAPKPSQTPAPVLPQPILLPELKPLVQGPDNSSEFELVFNPPEVEAPKPVSEISELGCVDDLPPSPQPLVDQKPEPSTPRGVVFRSISSDSSSSLSSELPAPIVEDFSEEKKDTAQSRPKRNVKKSPASKPSEKPIIPEAPSLENLTLSEKPITFVADLGSITQQKSSLKAPKPVAQEEPKEEKPIELTSNPEKMQSLAPPKRKDSDPEPVLGLITRTPEQMKAIVASQHQSASDSNNSAWEDSSSDKDKSEKKG